MWFSKYVGYSNYMTQQFLENKLHNGIMYYNEVNWDSIFMRH